MITIYDTKEFVQVREDGQQVVGVIDDALFETIIAFTSSIKTEEDIKQEFIDEKLSEMTDEEVLEKIALVKEWKPRVDYTQNELVKHEGVIYRLIKGLTRSTNIYPPDQVPSEYKRIEEVGALPEYGKYADGTVRDLGANPYSKGEQIAWNGQVCTWVFPTPNFWSPTDYAQAWDCKQ